MIDDGLVGSSLDQLGDDGPQDQRGAVQDGNVRILSVCGVLTVRCSPVQIQQR